MNRPSCVTAASAPGSPKPPNMSSVLAMAETAPPTPAVASHENHDEGPEHHDSLPLKPVRETHTANVDRDYETGRKTINEYEVIEEIGRGQHGKVKLARDSINGRMVAIKIIPRLSKTRRLGKVSAADPQQNTKREIAILKKIRHANVVALLEVIDDPELQKIYMVLEHVERGEIVWRKKGLPNVCYFERYRIEKGMHGQTLAPGENNWSDVLDRKAALRALLDARAKNLPPPPSRWSTDYGLTADDPDDGQLPWWFVTDHPGAEVDPPLFTSPLASRNTSRRPSRVPSAASLASLPTPASYGSEPSPLSVMAQDGDSAATAALHLLHPLHPSSHAVVSALEGSMYGPYTDDTLGLRNRSPSMVESLFSHMSSLDFNAVVHDPYADDFSYVPCFSIEQARSAFRDTVLGLEYLHYHGVVHRDIKPANLLWTRSFRVKISDFGVSYFGRPIRDDEQQEDPVPEAEARNFDDDRELSKTVGTPAFFAPELCYTDVGKEPPRVSEQIDVWSLGVTLYCLIFARIPFLAEDEFSMFRKIATEEPYIPSSRLRPVGIFTDPTGSSLYQRTNVLPYRSDADAQYEELSESLLELLRKMLTKNPDKRIRLRDVKRHKWVTEDLDNVPLWLDTTDPAKAKDRRIQVDDAEIVDAVVPLNFLQRARSAIKRTVDKVIHARSERDESAVSTSRRRATSSAASSIHEASAGPFGQSASALHHAGAHSRSLSNHLHQVHGHHHHHHHHPHHSPGAFHHHRDDRRPSLRGDDCFATVTQMPTEHPLSQSVTASPYASPGETTPNSDAAAHQLIAADGLWASPKLQPETREPPAAASLVLDGAADADRASSSSSSLKPLVRHTHSRSITNAMLSRETVLRGIFGEDSAPLPSHPGPSPGSSAATSVTTAVRRTREARAATDSGLERARSVDRAGIVFAQPDKRAAPVVGLNRDLAPGNMQKVPGIETNRLTLQIMVSPTSPLPSPEFFSPTAIAAYHTGEADANTDAEAGKTQTATCPPPAKQEGRTAMAQGHSHSRDVSSAVSEAMSQDVSPVCSSRRASQALLHKHLAFDLEQCGRHLPDAGSSTWDRGVTEASSSSASIGALSQTQTTPLTCSGEAEASILSSTINNALGGHKEGGMNAMVTFRSDPSLPALLSGASSVSADVEGEFLGNPGVVDGTSLIDVSGSLVTPAPEKAAVGLPLEPQHVAAGSLREQADWGSHGGAIPVELDAHRNTPRKTSMPMRSLSARTPVRTPVRADSMNSEDQDSDSDGGLIMARPPRRPAASRELTPMTTPTSTPVGSTPPSSAAVGRGQVVRRRDTNTSIESTETAKKVSVHGE